MSPSSKSLLLVLGNLVSVTMVAWSSRAFYLHADLAGWGDDADYLTLRVAEVACRGKRRALSKGVDNR